MSRFVVRLRGVNVGKGNRIAMADFRRLLEELGYTDVRTLLNSGNAVFSSSGRSAARHSNNIADTLQADLGVSVQVVVKSSAESPPPSPTIPSRPRRASIRVSLSPSARTSPPCKRWRH